MKLGARVWILIAVLVLAVFAINPRPWHEGLTITSVDTGSPAAEAGMTGPTAGVQPVIRERILALNGIDVDSLDSYEHALSSIEPDSLVQVRTNEESYVLAIPAENASFDPDDPVGLRVSLPPTTNVRKGLDLTGGARVLMKPEMPVDDSVMDLVLSNIQERLNVFGLSDVIVRSTKDFSGNQYILVEIAGANEDEIVELLTSQGKFEAKIGNTTVFMGGDDVTHVGRSATDSGLTRCNQAEEGVVCEFYFSISLSSEAAHRQADATNNLTIVPSSSGQSYLSKPLDLFLDGENISSLQIASSLKGRPETQIQITGSESGVTEEDAIAAAQAEMKKLQTVLSTGSLPVQLEVVKTDAISPALGSTFIKNIWLVGFIAIIAVIIVVASRYRDWRVSVPMVITMLSEVVIVLGIAALIGWNLDLAAIAGILIAIGTGVDDQIIIVDEIKSGRTGGSWKQRMKKAFFIIFAAFFTLLAAMLPLMWAGAGLVRGFAITTVLGVTVGVLVTRPAFAAIAEKVIAIKD